MPSHSVSKKAYFSAFSRSMAMLYPFAPYNRQRFTRDIVALDAPVFSATAIYVSPFLSIYSAKIFKEAIAFFFVFKPRHRREQLIHRLALNLAFVHLRPLRQQNIIHPYYIMPCRPSRIFQALLMCFCQTYIRPCLFPLSCRRIGTLSCPPRLWQRPSRE